VIGQTTKGLYCHLLTNLKNSKKQAKTSVEEKRQHN
jgi:hypothetical protein